MKKNILHISDLHLDEPCGAADTEHLRDAYYEEFFTSLPLALKSQGFSSPLDAIVASGDFVNKGKTKNFDHAKKVLRHLAGLWDLDDSRILTCVGNHDVVRSLEEEGREEEARLAYRTFAECFANGRGEAIGSGLAVGGFLDADLAFLSLDSTRGGINVPGRLESTEIDPVIRWVKRSNANVKPLIVCSHHPIDMAAGAVMGLESSDEIKRHLWVNASLLGSRIVENSVGPTLWLTGDIHRETDLVERKVAFCTTGRLGTSVLHSHGEVRRQITVFEVGADGDFAGWRAEFRTEGPAAHSGRWEARKIELARFERPRPAGTYFKKQIAEAEENENEIGGVGSLDKEKDKVKATEKLGKRGLVLLDESYQKELMRLIAEDGLYRLGRFETSSAGVTSLGWVSTDVLCGLDGQLEPISRRMGRWIRSEILEDKGLNVDQVGLIGLDSWGSIFACQIAAKLGVAFEPVATRPREAAKRKRESIDELLVDFVGKRKAVVLVTDVVGTGESILWLVRRIQDELDTEEGSILWFCVSLICDRAQERGDTLDILESHGCLCVDLRMPLLKASEMPSRVLLPPDFWVESSGQGDKGR